jgi:hypothetical protein
VEELVGELHQRITPELTRVEEATTKLAFDSEEAERALAAHQERVWQASD